MIPLSFGNSKLPTTTMIFNMTPATGCPSRALGLCKVGARCYALKAERLYPTCKPYRDRQALLWDKLTGFEIFSDIAKILERKRVKIKLFRFNESGDFRHQGDVDKLSAIAWQLKNKFGIKTYGYSARSDLDFSQATFIVKGSGHDHGNNGRTMVIGKNDPVPSGAFLCPGSCKTCSRCSRRDGKTIAFRLH